MAGSGSEGRRRAKAARAASRAADDAAERARHNAAANAAERAAFVARSAVPATGGDVTGGAGRAGPVPADKE